MIITKIDQQKKDKRRYNLYIDEQFRTGIHEDVIVMLGLYVKQVITEEYFEDIISKELFAKAKNYALQVISYRMRSEFEVVQKLKDKDYDLDVIDKVLAFLYEHKFLNDLEFAKAFISDKTQLSHHSIKKISFELKHKGVSMNTIEQAFNHFENEDIGLEDDSLKILVKKKYLTYERKNKYDDFELKQKVLQSLAQKGFRYDAIKKALQDYLESEDKQWKN